MKNRLTLARFLLNDLGGKVQPDAGLLVHEHLARHRLADEHVLVLRMPLDQAPGKYKEDDVLRQDVYSSFFKQGRRLDSLSNAEVALATVLGSIPATSDTVESEGRQVKQC